MRYEVTLEQAPARPTAVVAATTTWEAFPALWSGLLNEVWAGIAAAGLSRRCRNVMLYLDDVPNVEIGVELLEPTPPGGLGDRVVVSALPAGRVAATVHRGPYEGMAAAHEAVHVWCAEQGHKLAGPRWEIYGHHREDPAEMEIEIYYQLR